MFEEKESFTQRVGRHLVSMLMDFVQVVVMSLAIFVVVYIFLFQPNQVRGTSMVPTFENGEYLLTDKVTYRWVRKPQRGDIVVFHAPENENYDFIKRVIALPGETVKVLDGQVYIEGKLMPEPYLPTDLKTRSGAFLKEGVDYRVPQGSYIVFGDNRNFSSDSREWGPVLEEKIVGRAWFRYWPVPRVGIIEHQEDTLKGQ